MKKPRTYYANQLLGTQKQQLAADRFLALLTLKDVLGGRRTTFLAVKWGREPSAIRGLLGRARGLVYKCSGSTGLCDDLYAEYAGDASMLQMEAIRENRSKYGAVMAKLEGALLKDLNHPQTEALIRHMFEDEIEALFASRRSGDRKRTSFEAAVKRGPGKPIGRPPGSKNKPKDVVSEGESWPMPDGFTFTPTRSKPVMDALQTAVDPAGEWE